MMSTWRTDRRLGCLLMIACCAGCVGSEAEFVPVQGIVSYRDQPVAGATVALRGDGHATPAVGVTDASGAFSLRTGGEIGAAPGDHIVTVTKYVAETAPTGADVSMAEAGRGRVAAASRSAIPLRYASSAESNLRCTVKVEGDNQLELRLVD